MAAFVHMNAFSPRGLGSNVAVFLNKPEVERIVAIGEVLVELSEDRGVSLQERNFLLDACPPWSPLCYALESDAPLRHFMETARGPLLFSDDGDDNRKLLICGAAALRDFEALCLESEIPVGASWRMDFSPFGSGFVYFSGEEKYSETKVSCSAPLDMFRQLNERGGVTQGWSMEVTYGNSDANGK